MKKTNSKTNSWFWISILALVLFLIAPGQTLQAADEITIGYSGPLSGGAAKFGFNIQWGLELAADEINALGGATVGGKKYNVRVISMDDRFQAALAVNNAKRLVQKEGAKMVYNPNSGGIFALMAINENEKFIVGAYTTTQAVVTSGNKLLFKGPLPMQAYVHAFIEKAWAHGWKVCAMMPDAYEYGKIWSGLFEKAWKAKGGTITTTIPVDFMKTTDYYPMLTKALATKPDVLLLGSSSEPDAMQIRQARELGYKGGFILIERGKLDEIRAFVDNMETLNGCIGTTPLEMTPRDNVKPFAQKFRKKYGADKPLASELGISYANALIYVGAMVVAGTTTDVYKIMDAMLNKTKDVLALPFIKNNDPYGYTGAFPNGALKAKTYAIEVANGKYTECFLIDTPDHIYTAKE
jgi:branched-chain amino acid transport system substrate-binding protein